VIAVVIGRMPATVEVDPTAPLDGAGTAPADARQAALRTDFERAKAVSDARNPAGEAEKNPDTIIAEHKAALAAEPAAEESAALLAALGNLHRQKKRDYATAARYYEELLQKYPDWPGANSIYHQLISCYTQLNDQTSLRLLYRKMVEVFPVESNEYEFARHALDNP
jgi:tetratricopeptide (TPR) repeat protein